MLDNLMDMVKGQVVSTITEKTGLGADQAQQTLPLAKDSMIEGITGAFAKGNGGGVMDMISGFAGGGSGGGIGGMVKNAVYQNIASNFIGKMTSKLGIGQGIADQVSKFALPMIMSKFSDQVTDSSGNVQKDDLMSKLGIGDMLKNQAGNMLKDKLGGGGGGLGGAIGGMFGK